MSEHIVSRKLYVLVFLGLMVFTGITVSVAFIDLSFVVGGRVLNFNPAVALVIAFIKATLVILFFMHVKYSPRLTKIVVIAGIFWLGILLTITMTDYLSRHMMTYPAQ
jgi:cytochrome c oxidase subunit IV